MKNISLQHPHWSLPGTGLFRQLNFTSKSILLGVLMIVPLLLLQGYNLEQEYQRSLQARMDSTQQLVEGAHSAIEHAYSKFQAGRISETEAQTLASDTVAAMRYGDSGYFWINDMQMNIVMHPIKPELDGTYGGDLKDPNDVYIYKEIVDVVQQAQKGFVNYQWPKPGSDKAVDKLAFVKGFQPWGWVVGSGVYIDDIKAQQYSAMKQSGIVVLLVLLVVAYGFLCFLSAMKSGLTEVSTHLKKIAQGDLTSKPVKKGRDEAARLIDDLESMQSELIHIVEKVHHSSHHMSSSINEIVSGIADLTNRTETSSQRIEGSAASMEEITMTSKKSTENTDQASSVARHNAEVAASGGGAMEEMAVTMDEIKTSSAKISDIISTIDGIAFQTNLLALNASVEAARAGESGKGFAVVASEVGALAQRSAEAAQQVKSIIGTSVVQIEDGAKVVKRACNTMQQIVETSKQVDQLLDGVSHASKEQTQGVGQLSEALSALDRMAQDNVALVEQTLASTSSIKDSAASLASEVSRFKIPGSGSQSEGQKAA